MTLFGSAACAGPGATSKASAKAALAGNTRHTHCVTRVPGGAKSRGTQLASRVFSLDIQILPFGMQNGMLFEAFDPRANQLVTQPRDMQSPRGIHFHLPRHQ